MAPYVEKRRVKPVSYAVTDHDREMIEFIASYHGCGKSEAVRVAVRFYAERLAWLMPAFQEKIDAKTDVKI